MNELYILRHGVAVPHGTPGVPEADRPLTPKGEQRMRQIGRGLAALGLKLDRIFTSPLPRARRTAQIVAKELDMVDRLVTTSILSMDSDAKAIRGWLRDRGESSLMIVGHNPALSDLVGLLTLGEEAGLPVELKKGGIAALSCSPLSGPLFKLEWLAPPALLRRLAMDT
jgi:phosphohistidine phosphatase